MQAQSLLKLWKTLETKPFGKNIANFAIGKLVPYTGSISSQIILLEPGHSKVQLQDRRKVRNHLNSVHAIALANLGEFTTGLACLSSLPPSGRSILKKLEIEYIKKARGTLMAEAHTPLITEEIEKADCPIETEIKDSKGDVVAKVRAVWQVGCKK